MEGRGVRRERRRAWWKRRPPWQRGGGAELVLTFAKAQAFLREGGRLMEKELPVFYSQLFSLFALNFSFYFFNNWIFLNLIYLICIFIINLS